MIRPVALADTPALLSLTEATGVFKKHEIQALQEVLEEYHASNRGYGHVAVVDERDGRIVGYAYYAPASMTDRSWYLYWIAVTKAIQAKGVGSGLLNHAEEDIRAQERPRAVHRNVVAAALRPDAALLPETRLRSDGAAPRLLRGRRRHGGLPQASGGANERGESVPPPTGRASPVTRFAERRDRRILPFSPCLSTRYVPV